MNKEEKFNDILNDIFNNCGNTYEFIFDYYNNYCDKDDKHFYCMIAEAFQDIHSFSILFLEHKWTQSVIILRTAIERIAKIKVISYNPQIYNSFKDRYNDYKKFILMNEKEQDEYSKINHIDNKNKNNYFEYYWANSLNDNKPTGRNTFLKLAGLEETLIDIEETINKFVHGELSIFEIYNDKEKWNLMKRYGKRLIVICINLYRFLYLSLFNIIKCNIPIYLTNIYYKTEKLIKDF